MAINLAHLPRGFPAPWIALACLAALLALKLFEVTYRWSGAPPSRPRG